MRIVIAGQRNGRRVVRWSRILGLAIMLSTVATFGTGGVRYLIAGRWPHDAILFGITFGVGMVSAAVAIGLKTPVEKLTPLDPTDKE